MIRIKDIPLPPRHNVSQLSFEAAQLLRVSNSTIRKVKIVRRSIDARKKPDVKYSYTIDVQVNGNEEKILRNSRCKKASIAPWTGYKVKPIKNLDAKRPVVIGFGPAGMFAALVLAMDYTIRPRVEATYALVYDRRRNQIYFPYTLDEN